MFDDKKPRHSADLDMTIGIISSIISLLGFLGNLLAFTFFISTSKNDIASQLYIHLCIADVIICSSQIPVIQVLLRDNREPGLFRNTTFCEGWSFVHQLTKKFYVVVVMTLSISRSIAIVYPFYRIKKRLVFAVLYGYLFYLGLQEAARHFARVLFVYGADSAYCYPFFTNKDGNELPSSFVKADFASLSIQAGVPPILTFFSFIVSAKKLFSKRSFHCSSQTQQHRAGITITILTGVFLLCYLPVFALFTLLTVLIASGTELSYFTGPFSYYFMFWYSWLLADCCLNAVNAVLDPVIYFTRMRDMREWVLHKLRDCWKKRRLVINSRSASD